MERTTCCVIGGGPAGMVLGLLLARSGVEVTVLEKHADFLRDFRGDTVHPSTLALLDDLGLGERFDALPQRRLDRMRIPVGEDGEFATLADFRTLPVERDYIAMVPQWDFLDLLADEGSREPLFTLRRETEATEFVREGGRVRGVRYRTADGTAGELRATLVVACDGRDSIARALPELGVHDFATPMDVRWFKVPRRDSDPAGGVALIHRGSFTAMLDRGDYFQMASIIPKGTDREGRSEPIEAFNRALVERLPWLGDGRDLVQDWADVKVLHVTLDRMRRWHVPGLLCIGDAAHAMSPVGGIGINLAVQDAVAAARHLAAPLRDGRLRRRHVVAVQRRRRPTTVLVQRLQRLLHRRVVAPALRGEIEFSDRAALPLPLRLLQRVPWLRRIPPYVLAFGALRERPPEPARR